MTSAATLRTGRLAIVLLLFCKASAFAQPADVSLKPGNIVTVAGGATLEFPIPALQATLLGLCGVAIDKESGVVYLSDAILHQVLRLDPRSGVLSVFAGTGFGGFNGDGRSGPETELQVPCEMGVHPGTGDVYVADTNNYRIRRITRDGSRVETVAGAGILGTQEKNLATNPPVGSGFDVGGFSGDGGPPKKAELNLPAGIALSKGTVFFVADQGNNRIRGVNAGRRPVKVAGVDIAPNTIETVAGTGTFGYSGDGGAAVDAELASPREIVLDSKGNIFFVDSMNEALRRIDRETGVISTVVRDESSPYRPERDLMFPPSIDGLATGPDDTIYYSNLNQHSIFQIPADSGVPQLLAGVGLRGLVVEGGIANRTPVSGPGNIAVSKTGTIFVIETMAYALRKIEDDRIYTVAGGGSPGEGVPATSAVFSSLAPLAVGANGDLYIGDLNLQSIRRVDKKSGLIDTFAGRLALGSSRGPDQFRITKHARATNLLFAGDDRLFVSDAGLNVVRLFAREKGEWSVVRIAGQPGGPDTSGNGGPARKARLSVPVAIEMDGQQNLFVAGIFHPTIRKIDRLNYITAFAGTGRVGDTGNGGPALEATFNWPAALVADDRGNMFVSDFFNNVIRVIRPSGEIVAFAGTGAAGYSGDGEAALKAQFYNPADMVMDRKGNLYIADSNNHVVRRISAIPPYVVTTIAGTGTRGFTGDGGSALKAELNTPRGLALNDEQTLLYIADSLNRRVRAVRLDN